MTVIAPDRLPGAATHQPALLAGPWAAQVINILFAATVVLFFLGLFALAPIL